MATSEKYDSIIKCGEVQLNKNNWNLQLVCAECGKEIKEMQEFLLHSLQHHFSVTENEICYLISQISREKNGETEKTITKDVICPRSFFLKANVNDGVVHNILDKNESKVKSNSKKRKLFAEKNELFTKKITESTSFDETSLPSKKNLPTVEHVDVTALVKDKNDNQTNFEFLDTGIEGNTIIKLEADEVDCNLTNQQQLDPTECEIQAPANNIDDFTCKQCPKAFENITDYAKHIEQHVGSDLYDCPKCKKSYVLIAQLKKHLKIHAKNPKKKLKLNKSKDLNNTEGERDQSIVENPSTVIEPTIQNDQNEVLPQEIDIQNVLQTETTVENESAIADRIQENQQFGCKEPVTCKVSNISTKNRSNVIPHKDKESLEALDEKATNTKSSETAYREEKTIPQSECNETAEVEESTTCKICNKTFKNSTTATRHKQKHAPDFVKVVDSSKTKSKKKLEHKCDICEKIFYQRWSLKVHKRRHDKVAFLTCEICGATFPDGTNLNTHLKRHMGIKKHKCTLCDKSFVATTELKIHMRSHTGERPYACQECNRTFKTSSSYCNHRRRHTNERPCGCDTCGKRFFDKKSLRNHQISHTGETPFSCTKCGVSFGLQKSLKEHMKLHSGIKGHVCNICGEAFTQNAGLYLHMKRHK